VRGTDSHGRALYFAQNDLRSVNPDDGRAHERGELSDELLAGRKNLRSVCGPFSFSLRPVCGPEPREQPRTQANTLPPRLSVFEDFRACSLLFAVLQGNRGERLELAF
jgi:hypothetical protein